MYISRFFIKSAPPSLNSLDFFTYTSCHSLYLLMIIKPFMLLHYTPTLSPICEWDLNGIWNGLTTDLERTYNGPTPKARFRPSLAHRLRISHHW